MVMTILKALIVYYRTRNFLLNLVNLIENVVYILFFTIVTLESSITGGVLFLTVLYK